MLILTIAMVPTVTRAGPATCPATAPDRIATVRELLSKAEGVVREPGGSGLTIDVAELLAEAGEADAAEATLARISLDGRFGDVLLRRLATGYARNGDLARARRTIGRIRDADKAYAKQKALAWLFVGRALASVGRESEASEAYVEAMRDPDGYYPYAEGEFLAEIAEGQYRLGRSGEAASTFKKAADRAAMDRDSSDIGLSEIAAMQARLGLIRPAFETVDRIRDPLGWQGARQKIVETLAKVGRLSDAEGASKGITRPWTICSASFTLAGAYTSAGRAADARRCLKRAEDTLPQLSEEDRGGIAFGLGQRYGALGDRQRAEEWLDKAVALSEGSTVAQRGPLTATEVKPGAVARQGALSGIAAAQARLGLVERARSTFEKAKAAAKGEQPGIWQTTAIWNIAKLQAQAGLPDDAIHTMKLLPEREWLVDVEIAKAMARVGRVDEALQIAASCYGPSAMSDIADVLIARGEFERALTLALRFDGARDVLRVIGQHYAAEGDLKPVLNAVARTPFPDAKVSLLLGAVDGLLHPEERDKAAR